MDTSMSHMGIINITISIIKIIIKMGRNNEKKNSFNINVTINGSFC